MSRMPSSVARRHAKAVEQDILVACSVIDTHA